jgi:hypothetical protein
VPSKKRRRRRRRKKKKKKKIYPSGLEQIGSCSGVRVLHMCV